MNYRQFQKYPSDLGARGLWHPNPFGAPKNTQWRIWRWQWPSSPPSSPRIKANCRGWSHPEHTDMLGNRTASRFSGLGLLGCPHPHKSTINALMEQRGEGQGQGLQFWHTGNFHAFPKPSKSKVKLWRCQHIESHSKKQQLNWAAGLTPKCHHCSSKQHSVTETCASHNFRFWVTNTQLLERFMKKGGGTTKLNWNKSRDGPWTVQPQRQFAHPQTNTAGIKAACSSLCVPALSGLLSGAEIQRQRFNLHYKLHVAVQAWQFHGTAEKASRNLFCKAVTSARGGLEGIQEYSCAICSVGRRCLVMQIIFPFHNDIATSPYKPIKKGLVWLISTFKAGEIQCKLKNWSCLYLNGGVTFPDLIQMIFFWCFVPFLNGTSWRTATFTSAHLQGQNILKNNFKTCLPNVKKHSFPCSRWGGQDCSWGYFHHDFLEGWDHPRPSYWVTEGGEQQGTACSYHRRHLPHPRTEQILHVKHWKGRENADESEKKMNTSHTSACFPCTGRKSCYKRGPWSLLARRAGFLQHKGLSCPLNLSLFCKQDKPISKEWKSPKATRCYSCSADPTAPSDWSIQGFLTCSCRGFDPPWTSMA